MPSANVFPGIEVVSIEAQPSGDNRGILYEFFGYEGPFSEDVLGLSDVRDRLSGETELVYKLNVKASNPKLAERKAKNFVRIKNPFELSLVVGSRVEKIEDGVLDTYRVHVGVNK